MMAFEQNKPTIINEAVNGARDISARRAATISNMIDAAQQHGLNEDFAREAIRKYGEDNGRSMHAGMQNPDDFSEFAALFGSDHNREIFEMEVVNKTSDELEIDFHYCPYVTEWVKQGRSPQEISRLCEITMEGDHAFVHPFKQISFKLEGTIADGKRVCKLRFLHTKTAEPR
jgi:DNA-binding transcriptional regulator YdaS (Cro superfamily)